MIWSDSEGYFKYLPTVFIIGDIHKMPEGSVWPMKNDKGEILNKYTCGVACLQLPFFGLAMAYAGLKDQCTAEHVFSDVFAWSVAAAGLFYVLLGLFFLKKYLARSHEEPVVFITLISVLFGTNLFHYVTKESGMSHAYSFSLFCFFIFLADRNYRHPGRFLACITGLTLGLVTLIRPTNALILVLFALWECYNWKDIKQRFNFWAARLRLAPYFIIPVFLVWLPQLLYWKEMTGSLLNYSYQHEGFIYWDKPKILEVLFDTQNGLFLYTPMAILFLATLVIGLRAKKYSSPAILMVMVISTYLFASWWAWWFGGAFGARSYVEYYALLALPFAGFVNKVWQSRNHYLRAILALVWLFFIFYSIRLSYLYTSLPGPWDGEDWRWDLEKMYWIWKHLL